MVLRGHVIDGTIVLDEPATMPEGAVVEITFLPQDAPPTEPESRPSLYERMKSFVGKAETLPEDAASQVDHYLYGLPKR